jgi:nitrite reductase/ring-hydroxylating ferredoxin subunit
MSGEGSRGGEVGTSEPGADAVGDLTFCAPADEIGDGERRLIEAKGREIAIFNVGGEYYALANYCVHQGGPICEGQVSGALVEEDGELVWGQEGEIVSCPWHGWEFEIETGAHITTERYTLPTYDVTVHDGDIYLDI